MRSASFVVVAAILAGCARRAGGADLLTESRLARAAATCGVATWALRRQKGTALPFVDIVDPAYGSLEQAESSPARRCLRRELTRYRYDFIGVLNS